MSAKVITKRKIFHLSISKQIINREFWNKDYYNEYIKEEWDSEWDIDSLNKVIKHLRKMVKDARKKGHSDFLKLGTTNEKLKKGTIVGEENFINYSDIEEYQSGMKALEEEAESKTMVKIMERAFAVEEIKEEKEKGENYE